MMPELSLNILDIAQNSVHANADLIRITISADTAGDKLIISVADDGKGMTAEQVEKVTNPFFTSRTTRKVGLGVPFFKMAAELAGGEFSIESTPGVGTTTTASFQITNIDRMPLGDLAGTMATLVGSAPELDFVLTVTVDGADFVCDTREYRQILGNEVSLGAPEVLAFLQDAIREGMKELGADKL